MPMIHLTTPDRNSQVYEEEAAQALWQKGGIPEGTLYWIEGMQDWKPVTELFGTENPAVEQKKRTYIRDPRGLTRFVLIMLWIFLGMEMVSILSDIGMGMMLSREFTYEEATANENRQGIIAIVYVLTYILTAIAFLKWVYRATLNSGGFGAKRMTNTPGWSVGWYFVPIMTLFKPFEAMKEIWQVSLYPPRWRLQPVSGLLRWWWGLWLISNFVAQIVFRFPGESVEDLQLSTNLSILSSLIGIPLTLVAIRMISAIAGNQEAWVNNKPNPAAVRTGR